MIHSLSINLLGINQLYTIHNPCITLLYTWILPTKLQKYIKNSYIHCDLHNFLFCDQPGAYRRWKPQSNMLTTTVCILHHTSVVNSVCCVMP